IKYTPPGGSVTLRCGMYHGAAQSADEPQGWAFLEIEDDGPGVPEAERSQITQRFYRAQGAAGDGTGLGLAIAEEIALLHQ
uniref:ATP-binding protein n=2 Tax=Bacteria TaxID=2 RepID=UPI00370D6831